MTSRPLGLSPRSTGLPAPQSIRDGTRFPSLPGYSANGVPLHHRSATRGKHLILNQLTRRSRRFFLLGNASKTLAWHLSLLQKFGLRRVDGIPSVAIRRRGRRHYKGAQSFGVPAAHRQRPDFLDSLSKAPLLQEALLSAEALTHAFLLICGLFGRRKTNGIPRMPRAAQARNACRMPKASATTPTRTTATARATKFSAM